MYIHRGGTGGPLKQDDIHLAHNFIASCLLLVFCLALILILLKSGISLANKSFHLYDEL